MEKAKDTPWLRFHCGEVVPAWYEMYPVRDEANQCIGWSLHVHPSIHKLLEQYFHSGTPGIEAHRVAHGLEAIVPTTETKWGYGAVISTDSSGKHPGWLAYKSELPQLSKRDIGNLWESKPWMEIDATVQTLSQIFGLINYFPKETVDSSYQQLITIDYFVSRGGMSGSGLNVILSPAMRQWISENGKETWKKVEIAMFEAYYRINPQYKRDKAGFNCYSDKDRLFMNVPGQCACLGVDGHMADEPVNNPIEMSPHNIDNHEQLIVLFIGICAVFELAAAGLFASQV